MLFYNALTAMNGSGQVYASTLGFAVSNGQVDISSVLLDNVKGPFVADVSTVLPFAPAAIYRNDEVTTSAALSPYDVYYYNESARTVWIYNKRAAGRVTAVSPSASAPTSVTVAGVTYTIASPSVAYQLSSLSGGGVGQVVTLLLGMNDAAVSVLTGDAADAVFYGVVQSSSRTLVETNSAEVQQAVSVMCTDGTARTVNVNNKLNFPAGKLVEISVDGDGESVQSISPRSTSGTVSADGTALGDTPFADNVQIIDTTSEGVAGAVRPSRLSGVTLSESDIRYYTTNSAGQIDRVILDDVTGDLWEYAALDSVRRLTDEAAKKIDKKISDKAQDAAREAAGLPAATTTKVDKTDEETFQDVKNILVPAPAMCSTASSTAVSSALPGTPLPARRTSCSAMCSAAPATAWAVRWATSSTIWARVRPTSATPAASRWPTAPPPSTPLSQAASPSVVLLTARPSTGCSSSRR